MFVYVQCVLERVFMCVCAHKKDYVLWVRETMLVRESMLVREIGRKIQTRERLIERAKRRDAR